MEEPRHATVLDPGMQHLATVYAKALLGASEKAGVTEVVLAELESFVVDVLDRMPQFETSLVTPRVPFETKERLLDRAFGGKMSLTLLQFIKVLARRGRFEAVRAVQQAAKRILNELRGRVEVRLATAEPIDEATAESIIARLAAVLGRDVDMQARVDPELIGGMVIRIGDTVYDGSIANELRQLRNSLVARTTQTLRAQSDRFSVAN